MAEKTKDRRKKGKPKRRFVKGWMKEWPFLAFVTVLTVVIIILLWNYFWNLNGNNGDGNNNNNNPDPPRAIITIDKDNVFENDTATFDGSRSWGDVEQYLWDFGDGAEGNGPTVTHSYHKFGKFAVRLTVIDKRSEGHTDTAYIHVNHHEEQSSTVSVGMYKEYVIPVGNKCMGADIKLTYPTGQIIGGAPSNDLDIELYRPNGSLYFDSEAQTPDAGSTQIEEIHIPNQEMAAGFYQNWKVRVSSDSGINVKYDLVIEVYY